MKNLAPVATPGDAFHATPANAAMPATPETVARHASNPVCMFCANASTAAKLRPLSAAH